MQAIDYANLMRPAKAVSRLTFEDTVAQLKSAIQAEELWLIHEIDPQLLMRRGGYAMLATRQLLFFHPRYLVQLLEKDPSALVEAPLKLVVMEMPDGTVTLQHPDVATAFARYAGLEALGFEFQDLYLRLLTGIAD